MVWRGYGRIIEGRKHKNGGRLQFFGEKCVNLQRELITPATLCTESVCKRQPPAGTCLNRQSVEMDDYHAESLAYRRRG